MRIGVTGGRDFDNWHLVVHTLRQMPESAVLVHGAARGADKLCADWWAGVQERETDPHPADWNGPCRPECPAGHRRKRGDGGDYCPAAGVYRNQEMVDSGLDMLIAFPGNRGTADMVSRCQKAGVPVLDAVKGRLPDTSAISREEG